MTAPPQGSGVVLARAIELIGGLLLLAAGYYALLSRRASDSERRRQHRRTVLRISAGFAMFAYSAAVLVPEVSVWPAEFGDSLRTYFQELDAIPATINSELTAFYTALMEKVGVVTGPETSPDEPLGYFLEPIRTLGLVVYTLAFSAASLGLHVPHRVVRSVRSSGEADE